MASSIDINRRALLSSVANIGAGALLGSTASPSAAEAAEVDTLRSIAKEATIWGFPLVDNYRIQYSYFVDRGGPEFKAPWNTIANTARVYTPEDKAIQTPNSDTPYSYIGADLRAEPLVISVPSVEAGRYYSLQFIDQYTFNFAYVGSRATGNEAGSFLLAGPRWKGLKPPGVKSVIRCETDFAFVLYRTQLFEPAEFEKVKAIQAGYKVQPLSQFLGKPAPAAAPVIDFPRPLLPEQQRNSVEFFQILNFILQFCPTHASERGLRWRFARIGVEPGKALDVAKLAPERRKALEDGMADAWKAFAAFKASDLDTGKRTAAEGFGTRTFLKNDYVIRMASAALGIYGNSKEEALYPFYYSDSAGKPLNGKDGRYTLRFDPKNSFPVEAFWSLTVYELPQSLLSANAINRYLINSPMLSSLKRDPDGLVTLYLQHESPGSDREANWLPAPAGPFWTTLRLYWPKPEALDPHWKQPPLVRTA
ncbi:DUF1254 domain-containing protein [Rhodoblastus sp. 17X3]|uniref:DUF1254 domain-containing protein n=1 Tax=Rhodoblastus sp. 17X3 TaxID=3047026 RepID=UPI0024B86D03|nr:DUF1254 domain-containing protein [Rhodoblastus sp. 17X3]MDI9846751.1 DUF1254 domain-containing protein [Rhodoblastus sp. 17X3]